VTRWQEEESGWTRPSRSRRRTIGQDTLPEERELPSTSCPCSRSWVVRVDRGASNAKAKRELGWTLRYPSWRQGFVAAYGRPTPLKATR
jgi:hypothetical protein